MKRWWNDDALMWTEAAISSTVTGCAKCARIQDTASATRCTPDFGCPIWATRLPIGVRNSRIRISSTTSGPRSSASSGLRHQLEQARHGVDDGVGRLPDIQPAIVGRLGDATRVHPRGEFRHARGIQIQLEAEIRIPPAGARHLAGDRQIDGEDEHARGIVLEHLAAEHHDLGTLRHDAEGRAQRGVDGLGRHPRHGGWHRCPAAEAETRRRAARSARADWRVVAAPTRRERRG